MALNPYIELSKKLDLFGTIKFNTLPRTPSSTTEETLASKAKDFFPMVILQLQFEDLTQVRKAGRIENTGVGGGSNLLFSLLSRMIFPWNIHYPHLLVLLCSKTSLLF